MSSNATYTAGDPMPKPVLKQLNKLICYWCKKPLTVGDHTYWLDHDVHRACAKDCGECALCGRKLTLRLHSNNAWGIIDEEKMKESFPTILDRKTRICRFCHDNQTSRRSRYPRRPLESAKFREQYRKFLVGTAYPEIQCTFTDNDGFVTTGPYPDVKMKGVINAAIF